MTAREHAWARINHEMGTCREWLDGTFVRTLRQFEREAVKR